MGSWVDGRSTWIKGLPYPAQNFVRNRGKCFKQRVGNSILALNSVKMLKHKINLLVRVSIEKEVKKKEREKERERENKHSKSI